VYHIFPDLEDISCEYDIFFFCDIIIHLNDLNIQLQWKDRLVFEMFGLVKSFKLKIKLFSIQLLQGEIGHFSTCLKYIPQNKHDILGKRLRCNLIKDLFYVKMKKFSFC